MCRSLIVSDPDSNTETSNSTLTEIKRDSNAPASIKVDKWRGMVCNRILRTERHPFVSFNLSCIFFHQKVIKGVEGKEERTECNFSSCFLFYVPLNFWELRWLMSLTLGDTVST